MRVPYLKKNEFKMIPKQTCKILYNLDILFSIKTVKYARCLIKIKDIF